jgi:homopolymeric O-antigen transport system ATP-binding protein
MSDIILKAQNISKQYRLGLIGTGTISHDLNRWLHKVLGKDDPFLKVGEINDRSSFGKSDYVWALQDINFEVKRGEVLGIIGKNGAGKSTLLKILSRVTSPTTGEIKTKGRIASLLEVGTGFHPEMTGRENIYLNGAILGMTKKEICSKEDEIIDFSGCQRYIDTPVKRYSSGMRVRLAFAVAAHLEPDILVIDEVLAVGDAEFQKKAIGKMQDISQSEGRTVLFVSHNMESIQSLCTRCIILKDGIVSYDGNVGKAISLYLEFFGRISLSINFPILLEDLKIVDFQILNTYGDKVSTIILGLPYTFQLHLKNLKSEKNLNVRFQIFDKKENLVTTLNTYHTGDNIKARIDESIKFNCNVEKFSIAPSDYTIGIEILNLKNSDILYANENIFSFFVDNGDFYNTGKIPSSKNIGKFLTNYNWKINVNDLP